MKKITRAFIVLFISTFALSAHAYYKARSGYTQEIQFGVSAGLSDFDTSFPAAVTDTEDTDLTVRGFLGYRIGYLGLEIGYGMLGEATGEVAGSADFEANIFSTYTHVVGYLPFYSGNTGFYLEARAGGHYWDADFDNTAGNGGDNGLGLTYGAGMGYHFEHLIIALQWQRFELDANDEAGTRVDEIDSYLLTMAMAY